MHFPKSNFILPFKENRRKHGQFLFKSVQIKYHGVEFVKTNFLEPKFAQFGLTEQKLWIFKVSNFIAICCIWFLIAKFLTETICAKFIFG